MMPMLCVDLVLNVCFGKEWHIKVTQLRLVERANAKDPSFIFTQVLQKKRN